MRQLPCAVGDRIRLTRMDDDPNPVPVGSTGTVTRVHVMRWQGQEDHQISVKWDNGRTLSMIWPKDQFEVIPA